MLRKDSTDVLLERVEQVKNLWPTIWQAVKEIESHPGQEIPKRTALEIVVLVFMYCTELKSQVESCLVLFWWITLLILPLVGLLGYVIGVGTHTHE